MSLSERADDHGHWLDQAAMFRGLERFRTNPHVGQLLGRIRAERGGGGISESAWRIWFRHPAFSREETYADRGFERMVSVSGGDGFVTWSSDPGIGRTRAWRDRSIAYLVPAGRRPPRDLPSPLVTGPRLVAHWFDPVVGELLQPGGLLHPGLSLDVLGRRDVLGRGALMAPSLLAPPLRGSRPLSHRGRCATAGMATIWAADAGGAVAWRARCGFWPSPTR